MALSSLVSFLMCYCFYFDVYLRIGFSRLSTTILWLAKHLNTFRRSLLHFNYFISSYTAVSLPEHNSRIESCVSENCDFWFSVLFCRLIVLFTVVNFLEVTTCVLTAALNHGDEFVHAYLALHITITNSLLFYFLYPNILMWSIKEIVW